MKKRSKYSLWTLVALFAMAALISCGSDSSDSSTSYGLRAVSRTSVDFHTSSLQSASEGENTQPAVVFYREDAAEQGTASQEIYSFEYGPGAHLYWTAVMVEDGLGHTTGSALQTLDNAGFPVSATWYGPEGEFKSGYAFTYDQNLYLQISVICFRQDPTSTVDPKKAYEQTNTWNQDGILLAKTRKDYDTNGVLVSEYKWRSVTVPNSLRGAGGVGYYEYSREYEDGELTCQENIEFDDDGYPGRFTADLDGDDIPETDYYASTTKTGEGFLATLTWKDQNSGANVSKVVLGYGQDNLVQRVSSYEWQEGEFVLLSIVTDTWYPNPVGGPKGAIKEVCQTDEQGNPLQDYGTVDWTETGMTRRYYHSPDKEFMRITESLEKIELP